MAAPGGRETECIHIFGKYAVGMFNWKYVTVHGKVQDLPAA